MKPACTLWVGTQEREEWHHYGSDGQGKLKQSGKNEQVRIYKIKWEFRLSRQ